MTAIPGESGGCGGNPLLIQLRIAEKWGGQLPRVAGGNAVPPLNTDTLKNQ